MNTRRSKLSILVLLLLALGLTMLPAAGQDDLLSFSAADCDYGGNLKSVEAVGRAHRCRHPMQSGRAFRPGNGKPCLGHSP